MNWKTKELIVLIKKYKQHKKWTRTLEEFNLVNKESDHLMDLIVDQLLEERELWET